MAFCGARSGEFRNLLVEDVEDMEFEGGWIQVRSREGFETKNGEDRKIPLHPRLRALLEGVPDKGDWFFRSLPCNRYPDGSHHINVKRLNDDLCRIMQWLGLRTGGDDGFTIHSLRRFFRITAANAGVPERVVNLWLGHGEERSMGSIYYDLSDEESQGFMRRISFAENK